MSANFRDIPANFRDIPANFRDICVLFFVSTRNMLQTCFQLLWEFSSGISPNFLGLPFSYLQPRLPFSYYVMERAAKACEEPENTWNDQKLRYFKFSSLSHPGSSKSRFCWISLFFLALRAPQVVVFLGSMRCKSGSANKFNHHASCVLPPSHLRISLQFKLHQERIKICNPQPKNVLWEIILGVLEMPCAPQKSKWAAARTIHPTFPEAGNELKNI